MATINDDDHQVTEMGNGGGQRERMTMTGKAGRLYGIDKGEWMMVATEQPWQSHLSTKMTTGEQWLCGIEKGGWTKLATKQP